MPVGSTEPPIQSVPVDELLSKKYVKVPPCTIRSLSRCLYLRKSTHPTSHTIGPH